MLRVIEYLLLLFVFLIPWNARMILRAGELQGGFWEYGTIAIYATDVLFIVMLLLVGVWAIQRRLKLPITNYQLPIKSQFLISKKFIGYWILGIGYLFLSIFWSPDKFIALYAALKLFEGIILFFIVRKFQSYEVGPHKMGGPTSILLWVFIASAAVQSILAITQFFTQSVFTWPWSGIAPQNPSDLGVSVVQFGDERWLRAYGSFPHPNVLGAYLAIAIILLLQRFFAYHHEESRITNQESRRLKFLLLTSYSLILITGLFFTFSRAAWIAAILGIGYWFITTRAWRDRIVLQTVLLITGYTLLITVIFFPLVRTRVGGASRLEIQSNQERATGYREALQLIRRHPFFGVGIGNYTTAVAREFRPNDPAWSYQPAHNVFLLILSELGFVGFILFLRCVWQTKKFIIHNSSFFILLFILSLFDHSFWTLHSGILLFWGALAFNEGLDGTV